MSRDHLALAAQYQADVLSGAIPACQWVRLAMERNRRDLERQRSPDFPFHFDAAKGSAICRMAELLPHVKGPDAKIIGQDEQGRDLWATIELQPWQCWIFSTLHGWVRPDGRRRFRVGLILVPRKNGKSVLGAIEVLDGLTRDSVIGAEIYSAATTRDQAKVVAEIAWLMAKNSPPFREYYGVKLGSETTKSLRVPRTGAKFSPLSADANSLDGLNVFRAVVDELHAHKTRGVWDVLDTATGAQRDPLLLAITTAGVEIGGICYEKLGYLEKVLDGLVTDDSFFGINYTIDTGDDICDPVVQRKANPNYGVSVFAEDLERKVSEAQHSPSALNNVLTKHFNVWIRTESSWMTAGLWQSCAGAVDLEALRTVPCWIGVDLGEVRDFCALALLFKPAPDRYLLVSRVYSPAETIQRSPIAQLSGWVREGWIIETEGNEADYGRIEDDLLTFYNQLRVEQIDFDRRSARLMMQSLRKRLEPQLGRDRVQQVVLDIPQSLDTMDPAMKTCESLVLGQRLQHDGNPAVTWMMTNIVVERNHKGEIYPRKAGGKDSWNKIDLPVALFTALSQAMQTTSDPSFGLFFMGQRA